MSKKRTNYVNVFGLTILKRVDFEDLVFDWYNLEDKNNDLNSLVQAQQKEINRLKAQIKELETPKATEQKEEQSVAIEPTQKKKTFKRKPKSQQDKQTNQTNS